MALVTSEARWPLWATGRGHPTRFQLHVDRDPHSLSLVSLMPTLENLRPSWSLGRHCHFLNATPLTILTLSHLPVLVHQSAYHYQWHSLSVDLLTYWLLSYLEVSSIRTRTMVHVMSTILFQCLAQWLAHGRSLITHWSMNEWTSWALGDLQWLHKRGAAWVWYWVEFV